jgi:hypothetical protein
METRSSPAVPGRMPHAPAALQRTLDWATGLGHPKVLRYLLEIFPSASRH